MRISKLPEIGTKYEIESPKGDKVAVIFLTTGEIELYVLEAGADKPSVTRLTSEEARRVGSVLTGALLTIAPEDVEVSFSEISDLRINIHVCQVTKGVVGKSIEELAFRKKTGVTIIALSRRGRSVISPPPETVFEEGDLIVLIGESEQIKVCARDILGKG
ncbi:MAG: TrkA C-terminal domain-containing protein [Methanocellales archaeon]|nr:TrkA C-terminal domain-containing protein [Methanocellales archaeon]MDD3291916.1 TrkA C-terminal domain-containing protein [Methanocellales archaeon]MDD5235773.1 TrkA C-terminal domain-containing protein [Methanocellales archaeon]MDD5485530.1 TrkA C-terminal domain-containing protein [Methanocellales archaeon]